ncbi:MAG: aspartate aminotransferase family protein, partial [Planctomycetes bacterium]|nr:aspartate aminotransferase family protein [Planctomycetota bacterium]
RQELIALASKHLWHNFGVAADPSKAPKLLVRGEGVYVYDDEGKRYLDSFAGLLTTICGYHRPEVHKAVQDQMAKLEFFPLGYDCVLEPIVRLAKKLADVTPGDLSVAFFVNDGSEACETAIKMARNYFFVKGERSRNKIIFRRGSYHGATGLALSATGLSGNREPYEPLAPGFTHVMHAQCYRCELKLNPASWQPACLQNLEQTILWERPESVAAVIMDPIPGSNTGFPVPPDGYLQGVRRLCDKHGILLIFDEVQVGFGRTGKWFACENWGVTPDFLCVAKGFSGGFLPIGACVTTEKIAETFRTKGGFRHVHTFAGHPVTCASALACIEIIEREGLVQKAAEMGKYLSEKLWALHRKHPIIGDVRGMGTLWAVEMVANRETREYLNPRGQMGKRVNDYCRANGMILRNNSDILVLAPALSITHAEADEMVGIMDQAVAAATAS